ncbi:hypothetical protein F511_07139 [Dorcoceras hygrometricum]|nr:hypothetical protein F511_07139 [Dorcoceras hygrometricum]
MPSSTESPVRSVVNAIDSNPESPEVKGPWLPDQAELGSKNAPWYEEKSSNLRSSDISFIKEKGGMFDNFEVVIPGPEERAHLPPRDFHTFYINQLEMGLRFPLPRFIASLCQHMKISPSQLAPNSYSFLLALGVLLRYHNLPLVPYVLMQLVQVKRLGLRKFYLSHKGDHTFIKGNPSSQKGWMSRFFFVKWVGKKRDPWKCEMHWRDNMYTLTPRNPRSVTWPLSSTPCATRAITIPSLSRKISSVSSGLAGGGEAGNLRRNFDDAAEHYSELEKRLAEMEAARAEETRAAEVLKAALETRAELDETKARAAEEAERMRGEVANAWALGKEEFLQSSEFERLCTKKSVAYFKSGFEGDVAQFRANGYPEEEHPAPFLDAKKSLRDMPEDEEEAVEEGDEEEEEEEEEGGTTPPSSPKP